MTVSAIGSRPYRPPDPDADGLTPRQRADREESLRRAFEIKAECEMTAESAGIIVRSPLEEMESRLDITLDQAEALRRIAERFLERIEEAEK